jgi:formylglycine-generating enzyme required for sulfatase activity
MLRGVPVLVGIVVVAATAAMSRQEIPLDVPASELETQHPAGERWVNSIGMTFIRVPAGTFTMGSSATDAESHERPLHTVTISRPFFMATTEVT